MFVCHYYEYMLMSKVFSHPFLVIMIRQEKKELEKVIMIYYSCRFT